MNKVLDKSLTLEEALAVLRAHADELRAKGVKHAAIFGSLARGEANLGSDIDVLVELDYDSGIDLWGYAALREQISDWLGKRGDVVNIDTIRDFAKPSALRDAIRAF